MSNFKTYCRLIDYLDATDSDLAQLVRGTCVDLTLGSTKGKPGITLLIPDKEYRAKIAKLAYSSDPAEATKACDMLNALILRDVFKTGADFMSKRSNIPNSLYPSQHVGVKDVKGNSVTFESGATATLDSKFADSSKKGNLAVWHLKGEIPVTDDKPAKIERRPMRGVKGAKGSKSGGYDQEVATTLSANRRWKIAVAVENEYALSLIQRQIGGRSNPDPFVRCAMSLVEYLNEKEPERLKDALPLLSLSKADFYFLVEPHKGGDWLIPDYCIEDWWSKRSSHSTGAGCKILDSLLASAGNAKDLPRIDAIRKDLLQKCNSKGRECVELTEKEYKGKYGDGAELKLLQDELRFLIHCSFEELESSEYDGGKLGEIVNMIGEYMHKMTGTSDERKSGGRMLNAAALKYSIAPGEKVDTIKCFINSNYFMFTPLSAAESRVIPKSHTEMPKPGVKGVWNIVEANQQKYSTHSRIVGDNINPELEDALKGVDPDVADRIRAALKK
jgi:hypothetical protein